MAIAATVLLALTVLVSGVVPISAAPRNAHGKRLIIAPKPGQRLPAKPIWIRVRAAKRAELHVNLNGHAIERHFSPPRHGRHGVRSLRVSPSHGLRYGRNVLRVRRRAGGRTTRAKVAFRIRRNAPLAAAGLDRFVAIGDQVQLDATDSLVPPAPPGLPQGGRPHYNWSVVRSPGHHRGLARGQATATGVTLAGANSANPTLTADATGTYTLQLNVTAPDGTVGSDRLLLRVDPPLVVRLDTNYQQGGNYGVAIIRPDKPTPDFYPEGTGRWLHIVVLNRSTLAPVSNTSYPCTQAGTTADLSPCINAVKSDLATLDSSDLVIAVSQNRSNDNPYFQPPIDVQQALGGIGASYWNWWPSDVSTTRGTYSAVLVPKLPNLGVEYPATDKSAPGSGLIADNLVLDNDGNYDLAPGSRPAFNTQAAGSNNSQNVIEVAGKPFPQDVPGGAAQGGGFQVLTLDPRTLQATSNNWYETDHSDPGALNQQLQAMTAVLAQANTNPPFGVTPLVFIASRGNPVIRTFSGTINDSLRNLANEVEKAGGTRSRFFAAIDPGVSHGASYTLVGQGAFRLGGGSETTGPIGTTDGLNSVPLEGAFARTGQYYQYQLQTTEPALAAAGPGGDPGQGATQLIQTMGQAPVPWPEQGNSGRTDAIKWISLQVLRTDNIRSQYWTVVYDSSTWSSEPNGVLQQIAKQPFPGASGTHSFTDGTHTFTDTDFGWAQDELKREIGWLINEHTYLNNLATPFYKSALKSWADLQDISNDVNKDVSADSDLPAKETASAAFDLFESLGSEVPLAGEVIGATTAIYRYSAELTKIGGASVEDTFSTTVAHAGTDLANRLQAAQDFLTGRLANVIASDYGRLMTVGSCATIVAEVNADCPFNPSDWQYTQNDQTTAATALQTGSGINAYGVLLPAKYNPYVLPLNYRTSANDAWAGQPFVSCFYPFADSPATSQFAKPILRDIPNYGKGNINQITVLGHQTGSGYLSDRYQMQVPGPNVTDRLFGKLGGTTNGKPNLGANQEDFFDAFLYPPVTAGPFPERTTETGWISRCAPSLSSGPPLNAPASVTLKKATNDGIPVSFNVAGPSTAAITLEGPPAVGARSLARVRIRNLSPGRHNVGLRLGRRATDRVRRTHSHRFRVRLRITDGNRSTQTKVRPVRLRY